MLFCPHNLRIKCGCLDEEVLMTKYSIVTRSCKLKGRTPVRLHLRPRIFRDCFQSLSCGRSGFFCRSSSMALQSSICTQYHWKSILKKWLQFRNSILLDGAKQKLSWKTSVDLNSDETGSAVPNPQMSVLLKMSNKYNRLGPAQMEGLPRSVQQLCWQPASWHLTFWRSPSPRMETAPQKK